MSTSSKLDYKHIKDIVRKVMREIGLSESNMLVDYRNGFKIRVHIKNDLYVIFIFRVRDNRTEYCAVVFRSHNKHGEELIKWDNAHGYDHVHLKSGNKSLRKESDKRFDKDTIERDVRQVLETALKLAEQAYSQTP